MTSSVGQSFRKSLRRISDYYSANNKIVAQRIKKIELDRTINDGDSELSEEQDLRMYYLLKAYFF